jgi:hypothetical protein
MSNLDDDASSDDRLDEDNSIGTKVKINLADMNTSGRKEDLSKDLVIAQSILHEMEKVTPEHDTKLQDLKKFITEKIKKPINV